MTEQELNKAVAEAAGWYIKHHEDNVYSIRHGNASIPLTFASESTAWEALLASEGFCFATSLDAIASEEKRAGFRIRVVHAEAYVLAQALLAESGYAFSATDATEPRARCLAYLAAMKARKDTTHD